MDKHTTTSRTETPVFYRCKCKALFRKAYTFEVDRYQREDQVFSTIVRRAWLLDGVEVARGGRIPPAKCECGALIAGRAVKGRVTEHVCGAKCMAATGPSCECSCGGANHGKNYGG